MIFLFCDLFTRSLVLIYFLCVRHTSYARKKRGNEKTSIQASNVSFFLCGHGRIKINMDHRKSSLQIFQNYLRNNSGMGGFVTLVKKEATKNLDRSFECLFFFVWPWSNKKNTDHRKSSLQLFENYLRNNSDMGGFVKSSIISNSTDAS